MNSITQNSEVWEMIKSRIDSGSPFSTGSSAWQGSERIATLDGDIFLAIAFTQGTKIISLVATTKDSFLGSIPIAKRIGRGQYEALASQADIDQFFNQVAPQEKECLLDIALAEFGKRSQWDSVSTVTVWSNDNKEAYLKNQRGFIVLTLFKDAAKLSARKHSNPLVIGFWSPGDAMFVESHSVRDDYQAWSTEARRMVA